MSTSCPEVHVTPAVVKSVGVLRLEELAGELRGIAKTIGAQWQPGLLSAGMEIGSNTTLQTLASLSENFLKQADYLIAQAQALAKLANNITQVDEANCKPMADAGIRATGSAAATPFPTQ